MAGEYSWLYVTGSTVLTASGGFSTQATALNSGLTDPAHSFSSTAGFTVPAGRYIVGCQVLWNSNLTSSRWIYVHDSTNTVKYMHAYEDQVYMNSVSGVVQSFNIGLNLSGSTVLVPGFYVPSSTAADRTIASGDRTRMIVYRLD